MIDAIAQDGYTVYAAGFEKAEFAGGGKRSAGKRRSKRGTTSFCLCPPRATQKRSMRPSLRPAFRWTTISPPLCRRRPSSAA